MFLVLRKIRKINRNINTKQLITTKYRFEWTKKSERYNGCKRSWNALDFSYESLFAAWQRGLSSISLLWFLFVNLLKWAAFFGAILDKMCGFEHCYAVVRDKLRSQEIAFPPSSFLSIQFSQWNRILVA